jgi:hypothetical protein
MSRTSYHDLPYPLCALPDSNEPVTLVDLRDEALPRLQRVHCTLRALAVTVASDPAILHDLAPTLASLADDVDLCRDLIDCIPHGELREKAVPVLRGAHVILQGFSLLVARDTVLVEELPHALDDLADKVEACRDLVERATADV